MGGSPKTDASNESEDGTRETNAAKAPAVKDRECPYCHQHFTSSSLGRHLDQFISKKKPDGIHDVEGIRRLRGTITRRTARNSKHERASSHGVATSPNEELGTPVLDQLNKIPPNGLEIQLNTANWHCTGVINDIPSRLVKSSDPAAIIPVAGTKRSWNTYESGQRNSVSKKSDPTEEKDNVRALELALREVLDNLQAATYEHSTLTCACTTKQPSITELALGHPSNLVPLTSSSNPKPFHPSASFFSPPHQPSERHPRSIALSPFPSTLLDLRTSNHFA